MPWIPIPLIAELCQIFTDADARTRIDFQSGSVVNERDYLSRFLTLVNYPRITFGGKYRGIYSISCTPESIERKNGIDTIFIFKYRHQLKIAVGECKVEKEKFDNGRFSKQLARQADLLKTHPEIVAFEMFFHKTFREPFEKHVSTICTLKQINDFIDERHSGIPIKTWKLTDLEDLFEFLKYETPGAYTIFNFLNAILNCEQGDLLSDWSGHSSLTKKQSFIEATTNLVRGVTSNESSMEQVNYYMETYDIDAIGIVDFDRIKNNDQ